MKPGQLAIAVLAVLVVAGALVFTQTGGSGGGNGDDGGSRSKAPKGAVRVTFAYSP